MFRHRGSFDKLESFLRSMQKIDILKAIELYAQDGVFALSAATPQDSGLAASSWGYEIDHRGTSGTITWTNSNVESGFPVVIMLQYGYATGTGGYVQGNDYINPAIRPIFDRIADGVWKVVTSS
jgi:hypothetical protein